MSHVSHQDKLGQYAEAVQDYSHALALEPRNGNALHNRASAQVMSHMKESCLTCVSVYKVMGHVARGSTRFSCRVAHVNESCLIYE